MERMLIAFMMVVLLTPIAALAQEKAIKKGATMTVDETVRVTIKNPDGISNQETRFEFNDWCAVKGELGFTMTVIGVVGDKVLLRYNTIPGKQNASCPDGTVFFVPKSQYVEQMAKRARWISAEDESERIAVRQLLK